MRAWQRKADDVSPMNRILSARFGKGSNDPAPMYPTHSMATGHRQIPTAQTRPTPTRAFRIARCADEMQAAVDGNPICVMYLCYFHVSPTVLASVSTSQLILKNSKNTAMSFLQVVHVGNGWCPWLGVTRTSQALEMPPKPLCRSRQAQVLGRDAGKPLKN